MSNRDQDQRNPQNQQDNQRADDLRVAYDSDGRRPESGPSAAATTTAAGVDAAPAPPAAKGGGRGRG